MFFLRFVLGIIMFVCFFCVRNPVTFLQTASAANDDLSFSLPKLGNTSFFYPNKTITIFTPGDMPGQEDACLPLARPFVAPVIKQPLIFSNQPGRGGAYALNALLQNPDDGHFIALFALPGFMLETYAKTDALYKKSEIKPIAIIAQAPLALFVPEKSPITSVDDLTRLVRKSSPGSIFIAGSGLLAGDRIASLMLDRALGGTTTFYPHLGVKECIESTQKGHAAAFWANALAKEVMPNLRPLAVADDKRAEMLPDIPTFQELGLEVLLVQHYGLAVLATTQDSVQAQVSSFFETILTNPGFAAILRGKGYTPLYVPLPEIPRFMEVQKAKIDALLEEYPFPSL